MPIFGITKQVRKRLSGLLPGKRGTRIVTFVLAMAGLTSIVGGGWLVDSWDERVVTYTTTITTVVHPLRQTPVGVLIEGGIPLMLVGLLVAWVFLVAYKHK